MQQTLLFILLALTGSLAAWTNPVLLFNHSAFISAESVYRDPVTSVSHAIVYESYVKEMLHLSLDDQGNVLYCTVFGKTYTSPAVLRGAGDGKHLFAAISFEYLNPSWHSVNFTESSDGGKSWTVSSQIQLEGKRKDLQDMLYVVETGRVFVFFENANKEISVTSRAAGSTVFSVPTLVCKPGYTSFWFGYARATYSMATEGRPTLHVVYKAWAGNGDKLYYTRSSNNGATWSTGKSIEREGDRVSSVVGISALGQRVYIAYDLATWNAHVRLLYTEDQGQTFAPAMNISKADTPFAGTGLVVCSNKGKEAMAAFMVVRQDVVEYSVFNTKNMQQTYKEHAVGGKDFRSTALSCSVDAEKGILSVATFAEIRHNYRSTLYFAVESAPLPQ